MKSELLQNIMTNIVDTL